MSKLEQAAFVSYKWGGESEETVNQLDQALQARGIKLVRDKRDLGFKGSISEFMRRIGRGNCVIVVISDGYLRSPNCMFELVEIAKNKDFYDRVFPIVLGDADIYRTANRVKYIKYWEDQIKELDESMKSVSSANLQGIREEIDSYVEIRRWFAELTSTLSDMNALTPELHQQSDFNEMYLEIEKKLKESADLKLSEAVQQTIRTEPFEPETILIPAGPFWIGSEPEEGIPSYETPRHKVDLPAYRIGKHPVTNEQYAYFVRQEGSGVSQAMRWKGQEPPRELVKHPVLGVTLIQAIQYCDWLSRETKRSYSLPNEAQWEKACREFSQFIHFSGSFLEWTCSLWGKPNKFDTAYSYPWEDDGRNDLRANFRIGRVVRGCMAGEEANPRRCSVRRGRSADDPGTADMLHGFRVVLVE